MQSFYIGGLTLSNKPTPTRPRHCARNMAMKIGVLGEQSNTKSFGNLSARGDAAIW